MIDDLNEVEQDVLEEIDPDLVSYTFSTRGGDQLIYLYRRAIEVLMRVRATGNLDTAHFLDAIYRRMDD